MNHLAEAVKRLSEEGVFDSYKDHPNYKQLNKYAPGYNKPSDRFVKLANMPVKE